MIFQTCRRHPSAGAFLAECSGCKQELFDIQVANERRSAERKAAAEAAKLRAALGRYAQPETATRATVWSVFELDEIFAAVGGTVTARQVDRALADDERYMVTELTVTTTLSGIGEVEVVTDWVPADEPHGFGRAVIEAAGVSAAA